MSDFSKILSYLIFGFSVGGLLAALINHTEWAGWFVAITGWLLVIIYERRM
jgi:hypothetical protein